MGQIMQNLPPYQDGDEVILRISPEEFQTIKEALFIADLVVKTLPNDEYEALMGAYPSWSAEADKRLRVQ